jgi:hypothetical protein
VAIEDSWIEDHGCLTIIIGLVLLVVIGVLVLRFTAGGNTPTNPIICPSHNGGFCYYQATGRLSNGPQSIEYQGQSVAVRFDIPEVCADAPYTPPSATNGGYFQGPCQWVGQVGVWAVWTTPKDGMEATYSPLQPGETPP